jgi:hypothetical protein
MVFLVPKLKIMRHLAITFFEAVLLVGVSFGEATGVIEGTVVYTNGVPVIGATVCAYRLGAFVSASIVPHASTDGDGHYSLDLPFGRYSLVAGKPEEDYPDALYDTFYHGFSSRPEAKISSTKNGAIVNLRLAKKAGILIGSVTDASTGDPINANVEFRWISDPRIFISGSGLTNARFRILVPSDTPLSMVVSQSGYENWTYSSEGQTGVTSAILLHPGESINLDIQLKPKRVP